MSDERYPPEMPMLGASSPDTTQDQQHVSDGQDGGRDNDSIIMSDERYPMEMPTFSVSSPDTTQSQQQAPDSQDGGQGALEEPFRGITFSSLARFFDGQMQGPIHPQHQQYWIIRNLKTLSR